MEHSVPRAASTTTAAPPDLRPFAPQDAAGVAELFVAAMRGGRGRPTGPLAAYLASHFLNGPFADPRTPSQVAVRSTGEIVGFVGATRHSMVIDGAEKSIAIGSTLMVRDHARDPMTGARLMRALVSGPQDVTLSETASEESLPMWERLGGETLPLSSLEWIRVLRPAAFGLGQIAQRIGPLALLSPLARPFDAWATRRKPTPTWASLPRDFKPRGGALCVPIGEAEFRAAASEAFAAGDTRPLYSDDDLRIVVADALRKSGRGEAQLRAIRLPGGHQLGVALYHYRRGGIARLHSLLAPPARRGVALDAVLADALAQGATAIMGRSEPDLFEALSRRRIAFLRTSSTVVYARDKALLEPFRRGQVPLNGLFGERWSRLIGDSALWS